MPKTAHGAITPKADQTPIKVTLCNPDWFKQTDKLKVASPLPEASDLEFTGEDLNFLARVLFAEASGRLAHPDAGERMREKQAIIHVCYFRLGRKGYPNNAYVADSFTDVLKAPGQFESVFKANAKMNNSVAGLCESLGQSDCLDLVDSLEAVRGFLNSGPDYKSFPFDKFLAANGRRGWIPIGGNEFSLFPANRAAMEKAAGR